MQLAGQPLQQRGLRRARQRSVQGHDVLGPQRRAGARGGPWSRRNVAASCAAEHRGGRHLLLAQSTLPAPLDQRDAQGPHRRTPVGRDGAGDGQRDDPRSDGGDADDRRPAAARWRRAQIAALSVARATPPAHTPAVSSRGPPRRASSTNGLRACPRNTPPSGSPPKGHDMRTASAKRARTHEGRRAPAPGRRGAPRPRRRTAPRRERGRRRRTS